MQGASEVPLPATLDSGGDRELSIGVSPKDGLKKGTHDATLTIRYNDGADKTETVSLRFTVTDQPAPMESVVPIYRLYSNYSGEHLYTIYPSERNACVAMGWMDEGVLCYGLESSAMPVYRLRYGTDERNWHHYTMYRSEVEELSKVGWVYEGVAFYSDDQQRVPVYRQCWLGIDHNAPTGFAGEHNYTMSRDEHEHLISLGARDEQIGWYSVKGF